MAQLHLIKLCVGIDSVDQLLDWRARNPGRGSRHVTRMWPRRAKELLDGGSLYWVIKGAIQARQRVTGLEEVIGGDGIRRCAIVMDPQVIRTSPALRRPFQGWRYLAPADAPPDLRAERPGDTSLPADLNAALAEIGVR